ncbi:hypothetical protein ACFL29_01740 [Patescibacteria group bacterium]
MTKTFLITRPNDDATTRYLHAWSEKIIELAKKKGMQILDLSKKKANRQEVEGRLKKLNPELVMINGHGDIDCVTGYSQEILLKSGKNEKLLKSAIVYALSCKSAVVLGPKSIEAGCLAYIGYKADFIFVHKNKLNRPLEDKVAKLFLEPSNQVVVSLLKEHTAKESSVNSKKFSQRNIRKLLSSETSTNSSAYIDYLLWNMKNQVCLGDEGAEI